MLGFFNQPEPFADQKYKDLKAQCKETGQLFIDEKFPTNYHSLFTGGNQKISNIQWKRPGEISEKPKLFVEGTSSGDVHQGQLGNCWFVAATSCLAIHKALWSKIIPEPDEQEWNDEKPDQYQGIFHFRFWRHGIWVDVVIDDQLPTVNGKLIFISSQSKNEYWSALLEKAYAKLFGSYEALDGGGLEEALVDFTGGVAETVELQTPEYLESEDNRRALYEVLKKAINQKSLMAAAIPAESSEEMEARTDTGLVKGHAYGITEVKRAGLEGTGLFGMFNQDKINMIRLRNPWGKHEWNGRFSDSSPEWQKISESERKKMGLVFEDDGEFWMHFDDFCKHFVTVSVCRVVNQSIFSVNKTWEEGKLHSAWVPPMLAGGCANYKDTFLKNPQFAFSVTKTEDDVLLSLEQKTTDRAKKNETIGFHVFRVEHNRRTRMHEPLPVISSSKFKNSRSIFMRLTLSKGRYVVLPCTFDPGKQLEFLLRVYTDESMNPLHLTLDSPETLGGFCGLCGSSVQLGARVRFVRAHGLEKQDKVGGADPYLLVKCQNETVRIHTLYDTVDPEWKELESVLFFKTKASTPITVEIWNKNNIRDTFMGKAIVLASEPCENKAMELPLHGAKDNDPQPPGRLVVTVTVRQDVDTF
ncbi:calpain-5-like [Watersipora subatra]|uniref:calpain-5-like n=1 Tax=Watersipora subatra TaxID=2589382 RepID=UPI00355B6ADC